MADNHGNLTDETSDEIGITYRGLNIRNDEDENEEGIAEYLDLDLENTIVEDPLEDRAARESRATPILTSRTSVLRSELTTKPKRTRRAVRVKSTTHVSRKNSQRSRAANDSARRATTQSATIDHLETANVHAALDEINAKLAASVSSARDNDTPNERNPGQHPVTSFDLDESRVKHDSDSVDLFFRSMAQTVMTLPAATQARIKMDICKVIATAEMKYSTYDAAHAIQQG